MFISPHRPDDPRMVANLKLYTLFQTPEVLSPTNLQLDPPPNNVGSTGIKVESLQLTFETTPTTSSNSNSTALAIHILEELLHLFLFPCHKQQQFSPLFQWACSCSSLPSSRSMSSANYKLQSGRPPMDTGDSEMSISLGFSTASLVKQSFSDGCW